MSNRKELLSRRYNFAEYYEVDSDDPRKAIIHTLEECEPYVQRAKMLSELHPGETFRHAAVIPAHVINQAVREGWLHDDKKWIQWANDPDNRAFRSWPGRL